METTPRTEHPDRVRPGYRLGPFVFVPEWSVVRRPGAADPWAHRKAEPRAITLAWTVYLLLSAAGTLFATRSAGPARPWQYHNGARWLLVLASLGCCVLWPMTRLCQARPATGRTRAVLTDFAAIALPLAAVMLPLPVLTGWGWSVMPATWACESGWALLGLVVAYRAVTPPRGEASPVRRSAAMLLVLALMFGPMGLSLVVGAPAWLNAYSPFSALYRLLDPPGGHVAAADPVTLRAIAAVWFVALAALLFPTRPPG